MGGGTNLVNIFKFKKYWLLLIYNTFNSYVNNMLKKFVIKKVTFFNY